MNKTEIKVGVAIYLLIGLLLCGILTNDTWMKCGREVKTSEQVFMLTMWAPALVYVIVSMPFNKQPEKSCFSD